MAGRTRVKPSVKVAGARQLWLANRAGLLELRSEPEPDRPLTVEALWGPVGRATREREAGEPED